MMSKVSCKGFTIIEVVLVLAIAGLIFLMVFVALPALQRSQRDTQRRNDMSRVATALTQYQANNNKLPDDVNPATSDAVFIADYLGGTEFKDPDGSLYQVRIRTMNSPGDHVSLAGGSVDHIVDIYKNAKCGDNYINYNSGGKNYYALMYKLEGAGVYCIDNQ